MGLPGGGRNAVTPRFLRHFNVFSINAFSDDTMVRIFSSIVSFYLRNNEFSNEYFNVGNQIVTATMEVSDKVLISHDQIGLMHTNVQYCIFPTLIIEVFVSLKVYKKAMLNLLPTPAKSHYTFNLRDFSRVILGCLLVKKESVQNKHNLIRLFVHEVYRVYYDRLVDDTDRAWLYQLMKDILKTHFKESFERVFGHLKKGSKVSECDR